MPETAGPESAESDERSGFWTGVQMLAIAIALGWGCYRGGAEVWRALHTGLLRHGKGPDVALSERPLVFWTLNGFYGVVVLVTTGMAILCLLIAIRELTRERKA